jgi:hypothetical protein
LHEVDKEHGFGWREDGGIAGSELMRASKNASARKNSSPRPR